MLPSFGSLHQSFNEKNKTIFWTTKSILITFALSFLFLALPLNILAADGDTVWSRYNVGPGPQFDKPKELTLGLDGTVYVNTKRGNLVAIDPSDGSEKWSLPADYDMAPAIGTGDILYSGNGTGIAAINNSGSILWSLALGGEPTTSPVIAADGTLYIGVDNDLVAINPITQAEAWRFDTGNTVSFNPAIGPDGTVYVASENDLVAVDPATQTEKWRFSSTNSMTCSPVIGAYGIVYIGSQYLLFAVNPDGTKKWHFYAEGYIFTGPAVGSDLTIYLPVSVLGSGYNASGCLIAIHPEGYEKWRYRTGYYNRATPTLGFDDTIYLPSAEGNLIALDRYGALKWKHPVHGNANWSAPLAGDGTIFVSATMDQLKAIETSSPGLSNSPWPTNGKNNQRIGRNDEHTPACLGPVINSEPANQLIASGSTAVISVSASGTAPLNYQWYQGEIGDTGTPVAVGDSFTTPALTSSTSYWVLITNTCGATYSRVITISVGNEGEKKWTFTANEEILSCPALGSDGTIYFGTENAYLYAVNPDGTEKWSFAAHGYIGESGLVNGMYDNAATIGADGTIYIGSLGYFDAASHQRNFGYLWAVNPDGSEKWRYLTGDVLSGSGQGFPWVYGFPALGHDGTVYVTSGDAKLHGVNPDGTGAWIYSPESEVGWTRGTEAGSPIVAGDGTIYYSCEGDNGAATIPERYIIAVNSDGTHKWHLLLAGGGDNPSVDYWPLAIGSDGRIYVRGGDNAGLLYAVNPDGTEAWHFDVGETAFSAPSIDSDGTIYISGDIYDGNTKSTLYALNPDGTEKWRFPRTGDPDLFGSPLSTPAIGADGTLYFGVNTPNGNLYALNPDGTEKWSLYLSSIGRSSPVIAQDGTLYVCWGRGSTSTTIGFLYAVTTQSFGLADTPWPMVSKDVRHTAMVDADEQACNPPVITIQPQDHTIASGQTAHLSCNATGDALLFEWFQGESGDITTIVGTGQTFTTPALTTAIDYWVLVSNACGEAESRTATVSIAGSCVSPAITAQPQSQTVQFGQAAALSLSATGTVPLSYQWYQGTSGDTSAPVGANAASFTTPALTSDTSYWVMVSNACGNINSTTAGITIHSIPPAITMHPANQTIAPGDTATLSVTAAGDAPLNYQWYQGNSGDTSIPVGNNSTSYTTPSLTSNTNYWVRATNAFGTDDSNTATIRVADSASIPTLNEWGMIIISLMLAGSALWYMRRRTVL